MRKLMFGMCFLIGVILSAAACSSIGSMNEEDKAADVALSVIGDVERVIELLPKDEGILIVDAIARAGAVTDNSSVYLRGTDGMMASMDINELRENYLIYGNEGWEAVGVDCPPSFNVRSLADIVVVADNPAEVDASVTVQDENGIQRMISPGTLILMPQMSNPDFQGESEKNGRRVSVYTTDKYHIIGNTLLRLDGNHIIKEE